MFRLSLKYSPAQFETKRKEIGCGETVEREGGRKKPYDAYAKSVGTGGGGGGRGRGRGRGGGGGGGGRGRGSKFSRLLVWSCLSLSLSKQHCLDWWIGPSRTRGRKVRVKRMRRSCYTTTSFPKVVGKKEEEKGMQAKFGALETCREGGRRSISKQKLDCWLGLWGVLRLEAENIIVYNLYNNSKSSKILL